MATVRWICTCAIVVVLVGVSGFAQGRPVGEQEGVIGAWVLDLSSSKYTPGPPPKRETRTYEYEHEGIRTTIVTIDAAGKMREVEYIASYNDVEGVVSGSDRTDAVKMRLIDDTTAESTLFFQGKVVGTARRVLSRDGKTMTITFRQDAPTAVNNVAVYRRVSDR
jgi:hypothetical protein